MLILQFKRAECALADGRLDEAFALAMAPNMRAHRRGQDLAGNVARKLVKRGREHLDAGRLEEAHSDCEKACSLAGNLVEVGELRGAVAEALRGQRRDEQRKALAIEDARRQVAQGQLSVGARMLGPVESDTRALVIQDQIEGKRALADKLAEQAGEALRRGDWEAAIEPLAKACEASVQDGRTAALVAELHEQVSRKGREALVSGQLGLSASLMQRVARIGQGRVDGQDVRQCLGLSEEAWGAVAGGRFGEALERLRRLKVMLPEARWLDAALADAEAAAKGAEKLRCGPLSLLEMATMPYVHKPAAARGPTPIPGAPAPVRSSLPRRLLLQVDGVGGFLVLLDAKVRIGPARAGGGVDLPLPMDREATAFEIERVEEDYFMRSAAPVRVNDRAVSSKLLANGDRLAPGVRARLTFRLPSPASTSAVLDLNGLRLPSGDVSRVVLLDGELLIGPGSAAHIRDDQMPRPVALCVRDGALVVRSAEAVMANGTALPPGSAIPLSTHVQVGEAGFVVTPAAAA